MPEVPAGQNGKPDVPAGAAKPTPMYPINNGTNPYPAGPTGFMTSTKPSGPVGTGVVPLPSPTSVVLPEFSFASEVVPAASKTPSVESSAALPAASSAAVPAVSSAMPVEATSSAPANEYVKPTPTPMPTPAGNGYGSGYGTY
jgi:hypothetical protein